MGSPQRLDELSPPAKMLADLIPGIYLARNEEVGDRPLFALLEILAASLGDLEEAITQLGNDHFVERASPEALPLIAELVGARLLGDDPRTNRGVIGRTLHWRRRKGTLRTLEEVLTQASGWSTEVDEAFRSLLLNQDLANLIPWRGRTAMLWDPVAVADPLSRRAPHKQPRGQAAVLREALPELQPGENVETLLRKLGRADAGRHAASPRTIDFTGWARPENVIIRSSRLLHNELDRVAITTRHDIGRHDPVTGDMDPVVRFVGFRLDPCERDLPLVGRYTVEDPDAGQGLTDLHEPESGVDTEWDQSGRYYYAMLTPTLLAYNGDTAEQADNLSIFVDGVPIIGRDHSDTSGADLPFSPLGRDPVLRFADGQRPSPADEWDLQLVAVDNPDSLPANVATAAGTINPAPQDENPAVVWTVARKGHRDAEQIGAASHVPRAGSVVALRIARRNATRGYRRDAAGLWSTFEIGIRQGEPLTDVVWLDDQGDAVVTRLERLPGGELAVAAWYPDSPQTAWRVHSLDLSVLNDEDQPDYNSPHEGPQLGLAALDNVLLLVAPLAETDILGAWRIENALSAEPAIARLDLPVPRSPSARRCFALGVHENALFLHGGERQGGILKDLWSLPLQGTQQGRWCPHLVRNQQARSAGRLLSTARGLVLLGGASDIGALDGSVWRADVGQARVRWEPLPALPLPEGKPGVLWAMADADRLFVLAWADHVAPRPIQWREGDQAWLAGEPERPDAPNPPAEGEVLFQEEKVLVVGPPPLPPSEILFTMPEIEGDRALDVKLHRQGHLAFLPAVDLARPEDMALFFIQRNGSTVKWFPAGIEETENLRLAGGRQAPTGSRRAGQMRIGAPDRLAWHPLRLRQRSLGTWEPSVALTLEDTVALDPRLGKVLVRAEIVQGQLSASYRIGRWAPMGAGFKPVDSAIEDSWREPADADAPARFEIPAPPECLGGSEQVSAWILPDLAGGSREGIPIVADPVEGLKQGAAVKAMGFIGSPLMAPCRLALSYSQTLSLFAGSSGSVPHFSSEDGVSVFLQEQMTAGDTPESGPTCFFSGLTLAGCLEAVLTAGRVDLRWCTLAQPGKAGVRIAGAGHQSGLARRSLPPVRLTLALYGCMLGCLEVPPWVQVIAAGCTFDAGSAEEVAIAAAGARLRLRHCTVHGRTKAGVLEASSCAFKGNLICDRPDLSWARYALLPEGGRPPLLYKCLLHPISFASLNPTDPNYLVLDVNNGLAALNAAERRRVPGAHGLRSQQMLELTARTEDYLPMALMPYHVDRTTLDLLRMNRRIT